MRRYLRAALLSVFIGPPAAFGQHVPEGFWVDEQNIFVVEVFRCDQRLCAELVGLTPAVTARLDERNLDKAKRQRALCGLNVMGDLKESLRETGKWEGGWIYNPRDGKTYLSELRLDGPHRLKVRGYVLSPIFGRNLTLYRENVVTYRCSQTVQDGTESTG
jgi:uncharacterized protein (DUF2147 family)